MCGIVGVIGMKDAPSIVHAGLRRLEYRGYDSAGIAWSEAGGVEVRKCLGTPANLEVPQSPETTLAIGHTRWATHGGVCHENAHPHLDATSRFAVVHNGTLEGHRAMRQMLQADGHVLKSETDTEVLVHLFEKGRRNLGTEEALRELLQALAGSWAFIMLDSDDDSVAFATHRTPLVMGLLPDGKVILASDITAIVEHTRDVLFLEDGDHGVIRHGDIRLYDADGNKKALTTRRIDWDVKLAEKGGHAHFMLKEIHETPQALNQCLGGRIRHTPLHVDAGFPLSAWGKAQRVRLVGCGTSYNAGTLGAWFLEEWAGVPAQALVASDLRDRPPLEEAGTLYVGVSQSGETLDTLEALKGQVRLGHAIMGITNVQGSTLERISTGVSYTRVGPEVGVAATKTFSGQVAVLATWALQWGIQNGHIEHHEASLLADQLDRMPRTMEAVLDLEDELRELGHILSNHRDIFFLGHGAQLSTALEAALKFKEITYLHAEGFGAAELKHGPFALLDENTPCVFFVPQNAARHRTLGNIQEVRARGAPVYVITSGDASDLEGIADLVISVPETHHLLASLPFSLAGQLIAYHAAHALRRNIDMPRNLAKSVTVE